MMRPAANDADQKELMLSNIVIRAAHSSFFLANAIQAYQRTTQLERPALIEWLDITEGQLLRLELCRLPDATEPAHSKDVAAICGKFGIDPVKLETILTEVKSSNASQ